ncbi:hypothetical protein QBC47DRAFT_74523 [Echria macrotheca]|uniref:AMP-activated protein kinase glycogen-binding domain-containing protein n=1 Tax=Echria macrotheca TaxID=438768 RepID=A0AAJ0B4V1_9PEZI|nr:hypothetical protein QBC47DRAFT_74523 [Echria macrotheca]
MASKTRTFITYTKPGTQPPIFVAGTFSDPAWEPYEMEYEKGEDGEYTFKKEVFGEPGSKIQYKFRVGSGDWWVLHDDVPTVKDSNGNVNHELELPEVPSDGHDGQADGDVSDDQVSPKTVTPSGRAFPPGEIAQAPFKSLLASRSGASTPAFARIAAEVADSAALLNQEKPETPIPDELAGQIGYRRLTATPIIEVANTAAEVADTAKDLDNDDDVEEVTGFNIIPINEKPKQDNEFLEGYEIPEPKAPLFAHECVGMYDDEEDVHGSSSEDDAHRNAHTPKEEDNHVGMSEDGDEIDLNDPTLERFPSNREEIINRVRQLETGLTEDEPTFEGPPISPVYGPSSRRGTEDVISDLLLSPVPVSPVIPRAINRLAPPRSPRISAISAHSSSVSLHAIDESGEPDSEGESEDSPVIMRIAPHVRSSMPAPSSDEDEGVVLKDRHSPDDAKAKDTGNAEKKLDVSTSPRGGSEAAMDTEGHVQPEAHESRSQNEARNGHAGAVSPISTASGKDPTEETSMKPNGGTGETSATDVDGDASSTQLRKRGKPDSQNQGTVSHAGPAKPPRDKKGWLGAFFRVLFVDWIGGFLGRLFGGRRKL